MDPKINLDLSLDELIALNRTETSNKKQAASSKTFTPIRQPRRANQSYSRNQSRAAPYNKPSNNHLQPPPPNRPPPPLIVKTPYSNKNTFNRVYTNKLPENPSSGPRLESSRNTNFRQSNYPPPKMVYTREQQIKPAMVYGTSKDDSHITFRISGIQGLNKEELKHYLQSFGLSTSISFPSNSPNLVFVDYQFSSVTSVRTDAPTKVHFKGIELKFEPRPSQPNRNTISGNDYSYPRPKIISRTKETPNAFYVKDNSYHQGYSGDSEQITAGPVSITSTLPSSASIIISNVPMGLTAQELQSAFSSIGNVLKTDLLLDEMGNPTGRVAMRFDRLESAKEAVRRYDGGALNNQYIKVFLEG